MKKAFYILAGGAFIGILVGGGIFIKSYENIQVKINWPKSAELISKKEDINFSIQPNKELPFTKIKFSLIQGNKEKVLYSGPLTALEENFTFEPSKEGFKEGKATLLAILQTPFKKEIIYKKEVVIDLTPPKIELVYYPQRLNIGEPGIVRLLTSEKVSSIKVIAGNFTFPLLPTENSEEYQTFITAPLEFLNGVKPYFVKVIDLAGNSAKYYLPVEVKLKKFRQRHIYLTERTLKRIVYKYFPGAKDLVDKFRIINHEFRKEDSQKLKNLGLLSINTFYAEGKFLQLPGSKPTALYGDKRFYHYKGAIIDYAVHKGLDLAKYRHTPVPAANKGRVLFTGILKIYGKTILIDHGYGLMSLYAHLNDFTVKEGQVVKKGEIIGHTDTTGLALGDHLHFGILVWGIPVNPLWFFDSKYLDYYIYSHIKLSPSPDSK